MAISPKTRSTLRLVLVKTLGILLALLFLALAVLFLGSAAVVGLSTAKGLEADITAFSAHEGECRTAWEWGGLYRVDVEADGAAFTKVRCLYPGWPDLLTPSVGDSIHVWPADGPRVGAPPVEGWGWFLLGSFLLVGLVFFEFAFLSLTVR